MVCNGVPACRRRIRGEPCNEPEVRFEPQTQPVSAKLVSSVARTQAEYLVLGSIGLGSDVSEKLPPRPDAPHLAEVAERADKVGEQSDHLSESPSLAQAQSSREQTAQGAAWEGRAILTEAVRSRVYSKNRNHQVVR